MHSFNLIILCDGGCDSIMTGLEEHLGTPVEDAMTMLCVKNLNIQTYLLLLGASVDTFTMSTHKGIKKADFVNVL